MTIDLLEQKVPDASRAEVSNFIQLLNNNNNEVNLSSLSENDTNAEIDFFTILHDSESPKDLRPAYDYTTAMGLMDNNPLRDGDNPTVEAYQAGMQLPGLGPEQKEELFEMLLTAKQTLKFEAVYDYLSKLKNEGVLTQTQIQEFGNEVAKLAIAPDYKKTWKEDQVNELFGQLSEKAISTDDLKSAQVIFVKE